ncbi:uncharacterized protein LOC111009254 isoform X4 [Momordica charantia]|uniref:Uncharacterized protein LOC111009254 isoform X4 n=1 Tax=Momordica charantia TaxID=3673 RepID=A0A6J1CBT5_MOMCH|nr:uncharacterized protein LOC111009254 isoform X4 [Momordica charantia]XP_022137978.1 uncharacterized protein LOC111009254 isoform X4 [Momordica charantia]XP_022137979.1 uncharacterized protein LOC111009254 isoform X4 [Momordica charantia]
MGFLHLPIDVALKIASSLQASDICALACCSRLCREICDLDCLWESLARERWPYINASSSSGSSSSTLAKPPISTGWRNFYIRKHIEISGKAKAAVKFIEQCSPSTPIEAGDYHRAIAGLWDLKLSFVDVQMVLFKPQLNELLNLVGLHYCKNWLQVPLLAGKSSHGSTSKSQDFREACICEMVEAGKMVLWLPHERRTSDSSSLSGRTYSRRRGGYSRGA